MGKPACQRIAVRQGVCGTAAAEQRVVRVGAFPGHIARDGGSRREMVVPVVVDGQVVAVMDIDCAGFDEVDEEGLAKFAELIEGSCDWGERASPLSYE
ncbi:MAG: hypothetical protein Q9214_002634 [Letrouitia sp. 1 TL-2023]